MIAKLPAALVLAVACSLASAQEYPAREIRSIAGTPKPVIDRLAGWFNQITNAEDTKQFLARAALDAFPGTPESMTALLKTESERWGRWVRMAKIEPQ